MQAFTGMIAMFGFNYAPAGWSFANGTIVGITQYQVLYALIGSFYGGDGRVTFALPDFRARMPAGSTAMGVSPTVPGAFYPMGYMTGQTDIVISEQQMPIHNHSATFVGSGGGGGTAPTVDVQVSTVAGDTGTPVNGALLSKAPQISFTDVKSFQTNTGVGTVNLGGVTTSGGGGGITGGVVTVDTEGQSHSVSVVQPIQAVSFAIMMNGLFPSRN